MDSRYTSSHGHHGDSHEYHVFHVEFERVEIPFIIALWIFVSSLAKIGEYTMLKFLQRSIEGGTLFGSVRSKESVNMWKGKSTCLGTKYWRSLKNENGTMIAYPWMLLTLTFHCIKVNSAGKLWPKCRDDNQVEVSLWWTPEMSTAYNRNSGWSGASHPQFSLFTKDILAPLAPRS